MGLLDIFNSDDGRLGIGLLAAAGPRADGAGFGQRLQEAMTGLQAQKDADMKRKFMQSQMDNYASEIEQRKAAIEKQKLLQDMTQRVLGGQRPAMGSTELVNAALPPELRIGAQPAIPARGGLAAASLDDITALHALGGPDLLNAFKYAQEGTERKPGSVYRLPNGQLDMGPPTIGPNMQLTPKPGGGFSAGLVPGALDAANALAGGSANATESAKAALDLVDVPDGQGGSIKMTRADAARLFGQPNPQATINNPLRPSGPAPGMGGFSPSPQDLTTIQRDLQRNGVDPTDPRPPFVNFGQPAAGQLGRTPSAAELALKQQQLLAPGLKQQVADDAEVRAAQARENQRLEEQKQYQQMRAGVGQAIDLLKQGPTSSGIGSAVDSGLGFFGKSTPSGTLAASLDTISGWLTANVPRFSGPQSDRDVMNYRIMAGALGDRTKPIEQRLAAAKQLQAMQDKYAQLNGYADKPSDASSAPAAPGAAPPGGKTATLADIAATAKASGKSTAEVTKRMKELGYTIVGGQP